MAVFAYAATVVLKSALAFLAANTGDIHPVPGRGKLLGGKHYMPGDIHFKRVVVPEISNMFLFVS